MTPPSWVEQPIAELHGRLEPGPALLDGSGLSGRLPVCPFPSACRVGFPGVPLQNFRGRSLIVASTRLWLPGWLGSVSTGGEAPSGPSPPSRCRLTGTAYKLDARPGLRNRVTVEHQ